MEILIIGAIIVFIFIYTKKFDTHKFVEENEEYLIGLKEKDYDFFVKMKYGEKVNPNKLFISRIRNAVIMTLAITLLFLQNFSFLNFLFIALAAVGSYKLPYIQLKNYYKRYMSQIDQILPYYLKGLEILCQNYTVPVALSRSIQDAPPIFKEGLKELVAKIDAGDSSVQPYMDFAIKYPVRDSMRMMRLLYRLSLGAQENKYQQLLMFSSSVSSLQNKAREVKYKARLDSMEKRTMVMLVVTGGGTMVILLLSTMMLFGA